jgi:hypothetical protein
MQVGIVEKSWIGFVTCVTRRPFEGTKVIQLKPIESTCII